MAECCPVGEELIDSRAARANALMVVVILYAYLTTDHWLVVAFLAADFALRAFGSPKKAPLSMLSRKILDKLGIEPVLVNAAPKVFAARIGLTLTVAILVARLLGQRPLSYGLSMILIFCASLEGFLGFCLGCKIYSLLPRRAS